MTGSDFAILITEQIQVILPSWKIQYLIQICFSGTPITYGRSDSTALCSLLEINEKAGQMERSHSDCIILSSIFKPDVSLVGELKW